jgi:hypothetical protein
MKIEVIKGKVGDHGTGEVIELDDKAAERLIKLGYAKKSGGKSEETPQEKAAEKRKALEEKALELKVGTAEEIKALPDNDLTAKVNAKIRQVLIDKAVEAKLGTAEELAKLSDADLKDRIEKSGNEGVKGFFKNLFGGNK